LLFNSDGTLILSDGPGQLFDIDTATGIASNMRLVTGIDPVSLHRLSPQGLGRIITPRTNFYSIPPEAFVSASGNPVRTAWGSGGAYHTEARFDAMVASVHLPDGATITGFTMYFVDNDHADLSMWLQTRSHVGTTGRIISRVESSGVSGDDHTVDSLTQITSHKVNNESNSYAVRVAAHWPGTPALRINAALLEYVIRDAP
jgi:hypothetical protein